MFDRLIIGTANWRKEYNGCVCKDQDKILEYCQEVGIDTIELACAYDTHDMVLPRKMKRIVKISKFDKDNGKNIDIKKAWYCIMNHGVDGPLSIHTSIPHVNLGLSIYERDELPTFYDKFDIIQLPYSLMNRVNERLIKSLRYKNIEVHVRSIYLRGKCLQYTTAQECLKFVMCNPYVNKVVIGVDSLDMLKRNTDFIHKWNNMRCDDGEVIDPRRWSE